MKIQNNNNRTPTQTSASYPLQLRVNSHI